MELFSDNTIGTTSFFLRHSRSGSLGLAQHDDGSGIYPKRTYDFTRL
jgi:hypothetical protein